MNSKSGAIIIVSIMNLISLTSCKSDSLYDGMMNKENYKLEDNFINYVNPNGTFTKVESRFKSKYHYIPKDGYIGDMHPIFIEDKWFLYYLQVPREPKREGLNEVKNELVTSSDFLSWNKENISNDLNKRDWWAVANLIDKDKKMYSMYNDVLSNNGYGMDISENYRDFSYQGIKFPYSSVPGEPRDPFLYYNEQEKEYWFIFSVKKTNGKGATYYSITKNLKESFSEPKLLFEEENINVPECPEVFKLGKNYYYIASWGTNRVGTARYRMSTNPNGPWQKFDVDSLDSTELMAANSAFDGKRRLQFGWIPTYKNNLDGNTYEWGGHLAFPRELYADKTGKIYSRLPEEVNQIRQELIYSSNKKNALKYIRGEQWKTDGFSLLNEHSDGEVLFDINQESFDMSLDIRLLENNQFASIIFKKGNGEFSGYEVYIDSVNSKLGVKTSRGYKLERKIEITKEKNMNLRLIVDGDICEVFLDDKFSFSFRAQNLTTENYISCKSSGGSVIGNIEIYKI